MIMCPSFRFAEIVNFNFILKNPQVLNTLSEYSFKRMFKNESKPLLTKSQIRP